MELHVGTSGFAYTEWKGGFYPERLAEREMLGWYSHRFDTVEINNTFYRFPTAKGIAAWAAQVPAGFRFAIKVPQRITHIKRLRDVDGDVRYLLDTVTELGPRLGPLLFQMPPRLPLALELLEEVTAQLPPGLRVAFEFRDRRWLVEPVYRLLQRQGCALCFNDTAGAPLHPTTDWGYLRLRRERYGDSDLERIAGEVLDQPWYEAFVYFKHEAPDAPSLAHRWAAIATAAQNPGIGQVSYPRRTMNPRSSDDERA